MLLKMTDEPEDYEGPWPTEDAMTKPTVESVMRMIHDNEFMRNDAARDQIRAAIESLAAPAQGDAMTEWVMVPREPTMTMRRAGMDSFHLADGWPRVVYRAMLDAAPAAPQQAEPVAWAVCDPSGEAIYAALFKTRCVEYMDNEYRYGHSAAKNWTVRPVFLHPPPAEVQRLRDAARAVVNEHCVHGGLRTSVFNPLINELRRALEGK